MGIVIDTNVFIDTENGRLNLNNLDILSGNGDAYIGVTHGGSLGQGSKYQNPTLRIRGRYYSQNTSAGIQ